jgi:Rrf2 family protein
MRLTSKTRIGVQALYDMAVHWRGRQAQAKELARRQQIPVRTLEEVLQELRKGGLVEAQRGPRGGYTLARLPRDITMSEIVRALEGPVEHLFALRGPQQGSSGQRRGRPGVTAVARDAGDPDVPELVWGDIVDQIAAVLGQTTLGDFVARAERSGAPRDAAEPPHAMYVI